MGPTWQTIPSITDQMKTDPELRTYIGRARLVGPALTLEYVEFPVADMVAQSMGVKRGVFLEERFRLPGWSACFTAEDYPLDTTDADSRALGDALWEFVKEQTRTSRCAYWEAASLSDATLFEDDPDDDLYQYLWQADQDLNTARSLVRQGRAVLAHLGDERADRHVPEG